jgi:hypothetical protein
MAVQRLNTGAALWLQWTLASVMGTLIGSIPDILLGVRTPIGLSSDYRLLIFLLRGAWIGACLGVAQWLVLRRVLTDGGRWGLATTAGWTVGGLAYGSGAGLAPEIVGGGAVMGILQWRILKARVPRAHLWLIICVLGMALAPLAYPRRDFISPDLSVTAAAVSALMTAASGAISGALTGAVLVRLLEGAGELPGSAAAGLESEPRLGVEPRSLPARVALGCAIASWLAQFGLGAVFLWMILPPYSMTSYLYSQALVILWIAALFLALLATFAGGMELTRPGQGNPEAYVVARRALTLGICSMLLSVVAIGVWFLLALMSIP